MSRRSIRSVITAQCRDRNHEQPYGYPGDDGYQPPPNVRDRRVEVEPTHRVADLAACEDDIGKYVAHSVCPGRITEQRRSAVEFPVHDHREPQRERRAECEIPDTVRTECPDQAALTCDWSRNATDLGDQARTFFAAGTRFGSPCRSPTERTDQDRERHKRECVGGGELRTLAD
jgi:hypothetical protein